MPVWYYVLLAYVAAGLVLTYAGYNSMSQDVRSSFGPVTATLGILAVTAVAPVAWVAGVFKGLCHRVAAGWSKHTVNQ